MKGWAFALLLVGVIALPIALNGQGGPPMITDDPETPGNGKWEINVASTLRQHSGQRALECPAIDLNFGLGEHIQLKLEGTLALLKRHDAGLIAGLGDALTGIKWRFLDEDINGVSMSVYPQVEWNMAHASARRGLVENGTHILIPVQISRRLGWLVLDAEIGDSIDFVDGDEAFYGLLAAVSLNKNLELLAELHGVNKFDGSGSELTANWGARQKVDEHVTLLLSLGHDLHALRGEKRSFIAYLGVQFDL